MTTTNHKCALSQNQSEGGESKVVEAHSLLIPTTFTSDEQ